MLTHNDLEIKYGSGITLLFKGTEPFTEVENDIPSGVLIENDEGKVVCFICNEWFENLPTHLRSHDMDATAYRERFGFNRSAPLCSRGFSEKQAEKAMRAWTPTRAQEMISARSKRANERKTLGRPAGTSLRTQEKNRRNTCQEQIKARMQMLIDRFGESVSLRQARTTDPGIAMYPYRNGSDWNKFKESFGLKADTSSKRKERATLVTDLRAYVLSSNRLPWKRAATLDGFPHSKEPYLREFGSIRKAELFCGVYMKPDRSFAVLI